MNMVECMEDEIPTHCKGETGSEVTQKNQSAPRSGSKSYNKRKYKSLSLQTMRIWWTNSCWSRNQSGDLSKVKCFNCDNNGHLTKDYPKPFQVSECIAQGKLIFQKGFVTKIGAHKSEASNLLKLNCKINDKIVGCLLDSKATNSFMTSHVTKQFRFKIELVVYPIIVQSTQGITRTSLIVMLGIELFCSGVQLRTSPCVT
jgi:hypothetical protein